MQTLILLVLWLGLGFYPSNQHPVIDLSTTLSTQELVDFPHLFRPQGLAK